MKAKGIILLILLSSVLETLAIKHHYDEDEDENILSAI
jgi:hypothetical protein